VVRQERHLQLELREQEERVVVVQLFLPQVVLALLQVV
jgi:hypothetical protein